MLADDLSRDVRRSQIFLAGCVAITIAAYMLNIWLHAERPLSDSPRDWADFGTYLGGIVSPVVAYLAFYWLTRSVLLQKQELSETREALRDSANAQLKQEQHAAKTARLNALNSLLISLNSDISVLRSNSEFIAGQLLAASGTNRAYLPNGNTTNYDGAVGELQQLASRMLELGGQRDVVIEQVNELLR